MPNWVCNHLIIHGENAVEVMNSLLSENSESENGYDVDFNKIIPMPEDLRIESGSVTRDCAKLYVNAMLEGCDAYKKYAALYVQAFGKDLAMSEDEQIKTMEYVMLHKDYEKNCPLFKPKRTPMLTERRLWTITRNTVRKIGTVGVSKIGERNGTRSIRLSTIRAKRMSIFIPRGVRRSRSSTLFPKSIPNLLLIMSLPTKI